MGYSCVIQHYIIMYTQNICGTYTKIITLNRGKCAVIVVTNKGRNSFSVNDTLNIVS